MHNEYDWHLKNIFETDPKAGCELLFRKYYGPLCSHASRYVYSKEIAEDIVSEVFYSFWRDQSYQKITVSYHIYLFKAVRYRVQNYLRWEMTKSRRSSDSYENDLTDYHPSPAEVVQFDELHRKIEQTIERLPPQCKRAFLLNRFEGKKYAEVADELNIGIKTVETHISKALSILRTALKDEWMWVLIVLSTL